MVSNYFHYKSHQIQYLIICYRISLRFLLCKGIGFWTFHAWTKHFDTE